MEETKPNRKTRPIEFSLDLPQARTVSVAGTFNNWRADQAPLSKATDGIWRARVSLSAGRHEYRFVADGQWLSDPKAKIKVPNPFGGDNAVIVV